MSCVHHARESLEGHGPHFLRYGLKGDQPMPSTARTDATTSSHAIAGEAAPYFGMLSSVDVNRRTAMHPTAFQPKIVQQRSYAEPMVTSRTYHVNHHPNGIYSGIPQTVLKPNIHLQRANPHLWSSESAGGSSPLSEELTDSYPKSKIRKSSSHWSNGHLRGSFECYTRSPAPPASFDFKDRYHTQPSLRYSTSIPAAAPVHTRVVSTGLLTPRAGIAGSSTRGQAVYRGAMPAPTFTRMTHGETYNPPLSGRYTFTGIPTRVTYGGIPSTGGTVYPHVSYASPPPSGVVHSLPLGRTPLTSTGYRPSSCDAGPFTRASYDCIRRRSSLLSSANSNGLLESPYGAPKWYSFNVSPRQHG